MSLTLNELETQLNALPKWHHSKDDRRTITYYDITGKAYKGIDPSYHEKLIRHDDLEALFERIVRRVDPLTLSAASQLHGGASLSTAARLAAKKAIKKKADEAGDKLMDMDTSNMPPLAADLIKGLQTAKQVTDMAEKAVQILENPVVSKLLPKVIGPATEMLGTIAKFAGPIGYVALAASMVPDLIDVFTGKKSGTDMILNLVPGGMEIARMFGYQNDADKAEAQRKRDEEQDRKDSIRIQNVYNRWMKTTDQLLQTVAAITDPVLDWCKNHDKDIPEARKILDPAYASLKKFVDEKKQFLNQDFETSWIASRLNPTPHGNEPWKQYRSMEMVRFPPVADSDDPYGSTKWVKKGAEGPEEVTANWIRLPEEPGANSPANPAGPYVSDFCEMLFLSGTVRVITAYHGKGWDLNQSIATEKFYPDGANDFSYDSQPDGDNKPVHHYTFQGLGFDNSLMKSQPLVSRGSPMTSFGYPSDFDPEKFPSDFKKGPDGLWVSTASAKCGDGKRLGYGPFTSEKGETDTTWYVVEPSALTVVDRVDVGGYGWDEGKLVQGQGYQYKWVNQSDYKVSITDGTLWLRKVWDSKTVEALNSILNLDWAEGRSVECPTFLLLTNPVLMQAIQQQTDKGDDAPRTNLGDLLVQTAHSDADSRAAVAAEKEAQRVQAVAMGVREVMNADELKAYDAKQAALAIRSQTEQLNQMIREVTDPKLTPEQKAAKTKAIADATKAINEANAKNPDWKASAYSKEFLDKQKEFETQIEKQTEDQRKAMEDIIAKKEASDKAAAELQAKREADFQRDYERNQRNAVQGDPAAALSAMASSSGLSAPAPAPAPAPEPDMAEPVQTAPEPGPTAAPVQTSDADAVPDAPPPGNEDWGAPPPPDIPLADGYGGSLYGGSRRIKFWSEVDDKVDFPEDSFMNEVDYCVNDPAGWGAKGYKFTLSHNNPDVLFRLVQDRPSLLGLSLACPEKGLVEINAKNWINGVSKTRLSLPRYRQYLISHELGHMLGYEHSNPRPRGQPVPVMHQQSRLGVAGFTPNEKVVPSKRSRGGGGPGSGRRPRTAAAQRTYEALESAKVDMDESPPRLSPGANIFAIRKNGKQHPVYMFKMNVHDVQPFRVAPTWQGMAMGEAYPGYEILGIGQYRNVRSVTKDSEGNFRSRPVGWFPYTGAIDSNYFDIYDEGRLLQLVGYDGVQKLEEAAEFLTPTEEEELRLEAAVRETAEKKARSVQDEFNRAWEELTGLQWN